MWKDLGKRGEYGPNTSYDIPKKTRKNLEKEKRKKSRDKEESQRERESHLLVVR